MKKDKHPELILEKQEFLLLIWYTRLNKLVGYRKYLKEFLSDRRVIEVKPFNLANNTKFFYFNF